MLLSLTVFMLLVAEIMPATSDSVPLIGGLYLCVHVFTCNLFMCALMWNHQEEVTFAHLRGGHYNEQYISIELYCPFNRSKIKFSQRSEHQFMISTLNNCAKIEGLSLTYSWEIVFTRMEEMDRQTKKLKHYTSGHSCCRWETLNAYVCMCQT